jgi:hypothetical protein
MMVIVVKYIINTNFILIQKEYKFIVCEKKYYTSITILKKEPFSYFSKMVLLSLFNLIIFYFTRFNNTIDSQ